MQSLLRKYPGLIEAIIISFAVNLAYFETILYFALTLESIQGNALIFGLKFSLLTIIGWLIMLFAFSVENDSLKIILKDSQQKLLDSSRLIRRRLAFLALYFLLPFFIIILIVSSSDTIERIVTLLKPYIYEAIFFSSLLLILVLLRMLIIWCIKGITDTVPDLEGTVNSWMLSIKVSILYYIFLMIVAWFTIQPYHISDSGWRLWFYLVFFKDIILLSFITLLLFVSLHKLRKHRSLLIVFQNVNGYLIFILICTIIAILAIWADFVPMEDRWGEIIEAAGWQKRYKITHVYVRDIFLLLIPIAMFFLWTLQGVAREFKKPRESE